MKVYLSESTAKSLQNLLEFLDYKWGRKVRNQYLEKFKKKIDQIKNNPSSCPESTQMIGLRRCVVTKHNSFFYRVNKKQNALEIAALIDNRSELLSK